MAMHAYGTSGSVPVVETGNTTLAEIIIYPGAEVLAVDIANANEYNLDAFVLQAKSHPDSEYTTCADSAADFAAPRWPMLGVSGGTSDVTGLVKDTQAGISVDVQSLYAVKLLASATGGTTHVTVHWGM